MNSLTRRSICVAFVAATLTLAGCYGGGPRYAQYRASPTPELQTLSERHIDVDRHLIVTQDHNWRMFSEDLGRVFYLDHPSRLTPYPILSTSGVPR